MDTDLTFNEWYYQKYGIGTDDLTDEDYDAGYAEWLWAKSELGKLEQYLKDHGYNYTKSEHQIVVYSKDNQRKWDALCNDHSLGHEDGLLEVMGGVISSRSAHHIEGYLTAQDVIDRLEGKVR